MIKKTVLYFLLLFIGYNLLLFLAPSIKLTPQGNYDLNVIKGQTYFKNSSQFHSVVVGSSLGNRINSKIFPKEFYFLTFSGLGSADGLEIISRSPTLPRTVFIEINVLERVVNKSFILDVLNYAFIKFHKILPSFQKVNKPSSLLHKPIGYLVYGTRNQFIPN